MDRNANLASSPNSLQNTSSNGNSDGTSLLNLVKQNSVTFAISGMAAVLLIAFVAGFIMKRKKDRKADELSVTEDLSCHGAYRVYELAMPNKSSESLSFNSSEKNDKEKKETKFFSFGRRRKSVLDQKINEDELRPKMDLKGNHLRRRSSSANVFSSSSISERIPSKGIREKNQNGTFDYKWDPMIPNHSNQNSSLYPSLKTSNDDFLLKLNMNQQDGNKKIQDKSKELSIIDIAKIKRKHNFNLTADVHFPAPPSPAHMHSAVSSPSMPFSPLGTPGSSTSPYLSYSSPTLPKTHSPRPNIRKDLKEIDERPIFILQHHSPRSDSIHYNKNQKSMPRVGNSPIPMSPSSRQSTIVLNKQMPIVPNTPLKDAQKREQLAHTRMDKKSAGKSNDEDDSPIPDITQWKQLKYGPVIDETGRLPFQSAKLFSIKNSKKKTNTQLNPHSGQVMASSPSSTKTKITSVSSGLIYPTLCQSPMVSSVQFPFNGPTLSKPETPIDRTITYSSPYAGSETSDTKKQLSSPFGKLSVPSPIENLQHHELHTNKSLMTEKPSRVPFENITISIPALEEGEKDCNNHHLNSLDSNEDFISAYSSLDKGPLYEIPKLKKDEEDLIHQLQFML